MSLPHSKWSVKIYGRESANCDFPCAKLQNTIAKNLKFLIMKKTEIILNNIFVPNLVTLAWKISPGMPKEAGSLNGPLCAYLIRRNLHNRTRTRHLGYEYPCHISKWSVKIYGRESANGDFLCAKLENAKKKIAKIFWATMKKPGNYID